MDRKLSILMQELAHILSQQGLCEIARKDEAAKYWAFKHDQCLAALEARYKELGLALPVMVQAELDWNKLFQ